MGPSSIIVRKVKGSGFLVGVGVSLAGRGFSFGWSLWSLRPRFKLEGWSAAWFGAGVAWGGSSYLVGFGRPWSPPDA
jgi:hypothetical protein